jgi:hypothetical protein
MEKIHFPDDPHECWEWTGTVAGASSTNHPWPVTARPRITVQGKVLNVARVVCEWYHGPPPTSKHEAGHICPKGENARCVNPDHLRWMTRVENEQHKLTYKVAA